MKTLTRLFTSLFDKDTTSDYQKLYREWDKQRSKAISPSDLSEIDAIFSRHLNSR